MIEHQPTTSEKAAPDAGPWMLGYSKTLTPNSAHPLSQNLSYTGYMLINEYPFGMNSQPNLTRSILAASGIVLWDDIGERLAEDDLSPETLKQCKNDN